MDQLAHGDGIDARPGDASATSQDFVSWNPSLRPNSDRELHQDQDSRRGDFSTIPETAAVNGAITETVADSSRRLEDQHIGTFDREPEQGALLSDSSETVSSWTDLGGLENSTAAQPFDHHGRPEIPLTAGVPSQTSVLGSGRQHDTTASTSHGDVDSGNQFPANASSVAPDHSMAEPQAIAPPSHQNPMKSQNTHTSTPSFARTVSHTISWAEDEDESIPNRSNNGSPDPFAEMPDWQRSNSFPDVPAQHFPVSDTTKNVNPAAPLSRFEAVQDSTLESLGPSLENEGSSTDHLPAHATRIDEIFNDKAAIDGGTGPWNGDWLDPAADADARYEEGIPLVAEPDGRGTEVVPEVEPHPTPSAPESFSKTLERKSTSQVLDSLQFVPHHGSYSPDATVQEPESKNESSGSVEPPAGGFSPEKLNGSLGAVGGESAEDFEKPLSKGKDEDLADLWKAALDDDELLDENDSRPGLTDLFPDDDAGFLEDLDLQLGGEQSSQPPTSLNQVGLPTLPGNNPPEMTGSLSYSTEQDRFPGPPPNQPDLSGAPHSSNYYPSAGLRQQAMYDPLTAGGNLNPRPSTASGQGTNTSIQAWGNVPQQLAEKPPLQKSQSFADKSKGGYSSPYDLPMDVSRPRKKASVQHMGMNFNSHQGTNNVGPPPQGNVANHYTGYSASIPPAGFGSQMQGHAASNQTIPITTQRTATVPTAVPARPKASASEFFADLPISAPPRHPSRSGRYTPNPSPQVPAMPPQSSVPPPSQHPPRPQPPQAQSDQFRVEQSFGSVLPTPANQHNTSDRIIPLAGAANSMPNMRSIPPSSARYSPAPNPDRTRHETRPAGPFYNTVQHPASTTSLPHQPRTSSPLAYHSKTNYHSRSSDGAQPNVGVGQHYPEQESPAINHFSGRPAVLNEALATPLSYSSQDQPENRTFGHSIYGSHQNQQTISAQDIPLRDPYPPTSATGFLPAVGTQTLGSAVGIPQAPQQQHREHSGTFPEPTPAPFQRSQTQSPGSFARGFKHALTHDEPYQRPASVHDSAAPGYHSSAHVRPSAPGFSPLSGVPSKSSTYIVPTDGRENDALERWKGCPIFAWGFGGTVVTTFAKDVQRYSSGQTVPLIKRSPGELSIKPIKSILPLEENIASFPGPLKGKTKKKELLTWLTNRIEQAELNSQTVTVDQFHGGEPTLSEERTLLLKILRTLVENDGKIEGLPEAEKAVRSLLIPESSVGGESLTAIEGPGMGLSNISQPPGTSEIPKLANTVAIEQIRKLLLSGDREKAVWLAVDNKLWGHAMLVSSTLNREVWKQVIQEFVRQEVKNVGRNTESLAAIYEIFAGNWEESIEELVPPSARAGFQLVSKSAGPRQAGDGLQGLNKWKETLGLVLSNRSVDDGRALMALGKLLLDYGRTDAAHVCYVFARTFAVFGAAEDPQSSVVLLGANHVQQPFDYPRDLESILLSEVYEYTLSLSNSSPASAVAPHLQGYKLHHAILLAQHGYQSEAQQYCDTIYNTVKASTKASPFYHGPLIITLDDLSKRLQQAPKDGASSWIGRPSMEKVSGSIFAKFNSFVAGDDSDAASTGSGREGLLDVGPFAKVAGTPTISRSPSNPEMFGSYSPLDPLPLPHGPTDSPGSLGRSSRYAPSGPYAPRTSQEQQRSVTDIGRPFQPQSETYGTADPMGIQTAQSPYTSYEPLISPPGLAPSALQYPSANNFYPDQSAQNQEAAYGGNPYSPMDQPEARLTGLGDRHASETENANTSSRTGDPYSYSHYQPTNGSSYDQSPHGGSKPPSPGPEIPSDGETPRRQNFTQDDDDDGLVAGAAALARAEKAEKDRQADENIRRAAAADAQKSQGNGDKKGWFGGWFGKKDPSAGPGPIRAKLGEESSFYYDPDLKKWVNKKGGATEGPAKAAPPPPKGPPSRSTSGAGPPAAPSSSVPPVSRSSPNLSTPPTMSRPSSSGLAAPRSGTSHPLSREASADGNSDSLLAPGNSSVSGPPSNPPSRPPTSMSNTSDIDDLLGPAGAPRKGGTLKKGKKGRGYVDVMANKPT